MEDHHTWQEAYEAAIRREWIERALVTLLCLAIGVSGFLVWRNWDTRFERVFRPIPGLSYEPPPIVNGVAVTDISEPLTFQKLAPKDAYAFNASVPVSTEPMRPSAAFAISTAAGTDGARALDCLTAAVYYEAASESLDGQRAVAQVVLNRMRHPAFPHSVCGVVFSGSTRQTGCQFTFTCDGSLARKPNARGWARARIIAQAALSGQVYAGVGQATHYHTLWVAPYWSPSLVKVANIGAHTFYRWKGVTGSPAAFNSPYAGVEPLVNMSPEAVDETLAESEANAEAINVPANLDARQAADQGAGPQETAMRPPAEPITVAPPPAADVVPKTAEAAPAPLAPPAVRRRPRVATPSW